MDTQIQGDKVIITTTSDLSEYVQTKQAQVDLITKQITSLNTRLQTLLNELSALVK